MIDAGRYDDRVSLDDGHRDVRGGCRRLGIEPPHVEEHEHPTALDHLADLGPTNVIAVTGRMAMTKRSRTFGSKATACERCELIAEPGRRAIVPGKGHSVEHPVDDGVAFLRRQWAQSYLFEFVTAS